MMILAKVWETAVGTAATVSVWKPVNAAMKLTSALYQKRKSTSQQIDFHTEGKVWE